MENTDQATREQIWCNSCNTETWHVQLSHHSASKIIYDDIEVRPGETERMVVSQYDEDWGVLQCLGCDNITIKKKTHDQITGDNYWRYYPERPKTGREEKFFLKIPRHLSQIYTEVVKAYNQNLLVLCAGGIRALLEGLCVDKKITKGTTSSGQIRENLEGKINGLQDIVPANIVKNLHGLRFLGNKALHELEVPNKRDLELALTVIEDILNVVYDLDYRAGSLHKSVKRKSKRKK